MKKVRYLIYCILHMDYARFFRTINEVAAESGKSRIFLFFDIVYCGLKYGAGYRDYAVCKWYGLTRAQRETYVTRAINNSIARLKNDRAYNHYFDKKQDFNKEFARYIKRKWLYTPESTFAQFEEMMTDLDQVIIKPCDATCGEGVEKISKADFGSLEEMYEYITSKGAYMIEEVIKQHEAISKLYPYSINTLRIVTVLNENGANVVYAFIRIGNNMKVVDNINSGGMCAPIDLETGIITHVGYDKDGNTYECHPITGTRIVGYQIPMWQQSLDMCTEAAMIVPQVGYIAWDVAVTPDGPCFVEGNNMPGHDILQLPPHVPDKIGMLPRFKEFIKEL